MQKYTFIVDTQHRYANASHTLITHICELRPINTKQKNNTYTMIHTLRMYIANIYY